MKIFKDLHTHSRYSKFNHGKSSCEELVIAAIDKGLKSIAITDHAPSHPFGVWKKNLLKRKNEILLLRNKYPQIEILCGLETNLISASGKIDISKQQRSQLDICLMGFHKAGFGTFWNMITFGLWKTLFGKYQIKSNTNSYINAINNNDIDIITHLQQYIKVDAKAVAEAAAKKGTLIEINNRHLKWTDEDISGMLQTDCKFIINSDAHSSNSVSVFENAIDFAIKHNIPLNRIVNAKEK